MNDVFEGGEQLERELKPEPYIGPAAGSLGLHLALAALLAYSGWVMGIFHHGEWGGPGAAGSMQVNLVSSALPLPAEQMNQNVLATETPSQAPAAPSPKEQHHEDETAIPIASKSAKTTPKPQNTPKTQQHQQPTKQQNLAQYGEQAGSMMPRQTQFGNGGPATVGDGNFASLYGWYVDQINRKMNQSWYKGEVDPRTPKGTRVYLIFTVHRDGSVSDLQLDRSSGSPTLDQSCKRGVQRVDTFGNLPAAYNQSTLRVGYYCEY
jgi:protein TonB